MKVTKELKFKRAVDKGIPVSEGGSFKFDRGKNGLHKGVDIKANWGTKVWASEGGVVVFSGYVAGSAAKGNYGNMIIIDHVPESGDKGRHIYSLYAHLDRRKVRKGTKEKPTIVTKGAIIGTTGNSGTRNSYITKNKKGEKIEKEDQGQFHLHFEIIDSPRKLTWGPGNFHGSSFRVNPMMRGGYVGSTITVEFDAGEDETDTFGGRNSFAKPSLRTGRW